MNRREFLHHFSIYLLTTSATCGMGRAACAQWPGQGGDSTNGDSGWPIGARHGEQGVDARFRIEGCSLSGDLANRFNFIRSSGIPQIDQATVSEVRNLAGVTGLHPSFAFLDDKRAKNAFAIKQDIINGRSPHGAVAMGVRLIQDFLELPTLNRYSNSLCIQAALVHEWAHIGQFTYGVRASRIKHTELMADFMAGWYVGYKDAMTGRQSDVSSAMLGMFSLGDTNFSSPGHHGTPRERLEAYTSGVLFVRQGTGGGFDGGGGMAGGFLHDGGLNVGGGYGRPQPPDFATAFNYAAQTYIR